MCTNGVNTTQFEAMLEMIDDSVKMERRWVHQMAHQAADSGFASTGEKLHAVQAALDDVRAMLADAKDIMEEEAEGAAGVSVSLV